MFTSVADLEGAKRHIPLIYTVSQKSSHLNTLWRPNFVEIFNDFNTFCIAGIHMKFATKSIGLRQYPPQKFKFLAA